MIFLFLTIKKYDIISCVMAVFLIVMTFNYIKKSTDSIVTSAPPGNGKVIVIDAGHGTPDSGAVGINGSLEKDINLDVAVKLQKLLEQGGVHVLLTRADDNAVTENLEQKIREIKRSDLNNRRDFKNDSECDAFVSIHMNKFTASQYSGAQVFYADKPEASRLLGEHIQHRLIENLDPQNTRVAKKADGNIYILKNSTVPSVIVECGFLSNPAEEAKLLDGNYQDRVAFAIYYGIMDYISAADTSND